MKKILITGAAGFIGHHLVHALVKYPNNQVIGIDNLNDYYSPQLKIGRLEDQGITLIDELNTLIKSQKVNNYSFAQIDLVDEVALDQLFKSEQFDIVVNLAAQAGVRYSLENPRSYIQSNMVGFSNLLEVCKNHSIQHLVYASSSSVYGLNKSVPFKTSDNVDHPISMYAASKKSNELMAHVYSHLYGLRTTGLRFFTVYGPWGRPDMAYYSFANAIINEKPIKVFNHGNLSRDFTYIDDIINGIVAIINGSASGSNYRLYNIGNSQPVNLLEFIQILEKAMGKEAIKEFVDMQPGDVHTTYADVSDLERDFGYRPSTSLEEGIGRFVEWYRDYC